MANCFITIHELLAYLPRKSISPEVVFALESCFPQFVKESQPSIVLGSVVNAFEFDFIDILKEKLPEIGEIDIFATEKRVPVLQLAICHADSSLACAILAHEIGHAIDSERDISSGIVRELLTGSDADEDSLETLHNWCGELCADLIASRFVGPAPMLSLLSMEYCIQPAYDIYMHSDTHPSTHSRLRVVKSDLTGTAAALVQSEMQLYDASWHVNLKQHLANSQEQPNEEDMHERITDELILPMAELVRNKLEESLEGLERSTPLDETSLQRCVDRLQLGSPASPGATS